MLFEKALQCGPVVEQGRGNFAGHQRQGLQPAVEFGIELGGNDRGRRELLLAEEMRHVLTQAARRV
ncbi:MAG: hypothetical protein AW07_01157 [Candidatus Accumulibacter sp. SK-11]|nr:MAG: hypothetical protein AW07_01157 [Candidatus Accumulibacter sp. SK-11]